MYSIATFPSQRFIQIIYIKQLYLGVKLKLKHQLWYLFLFYLTTFQLQQVSYRCYCTLLKLHDLFLRYWNQFLTTEPFYN